jgi:hypothetical protein
MKASQCIVTRTLLFSENIFTKFFKLSLPTQNPQPTAAQNFSTGEGWPAGKREKMSEKGRAHRKMEKKKCWRGERSKLALRLCV